MSASRALVGGRHDAAVAGFRSAALRSDSWQDWNDLAVAFIERSSDGARPLDHLRALSTSHRAVALAPAMPEPLYNHALALSLLHLRRSAVRAWKDFIAVANGLPGAEDEVASAEVQVARMSEPTHRERWKRAVPELESALFTGRPERVGMIVSEFPDLARNHAERQLTQRWCEAILAGDWTEADRVVVLGRAIGETLARQRGEHSIADQFRFLESCRIRADRGADCARATAAYVEGVTAFYTGRPGAAEASLSRAAEALRAEGSPLHRWADYFLVYATFQRSIPESLEAVRDQLDSYVESRYPSLAGRLHWRWGVGAASLGRNQEARDHYQRGQELLFAGAGEVESSMGHMLLAEAYDLIGDAESAWWHRLELFGVAAESGDARAVHATLGTAVPALLREGEIANAITLLDEQVANALDAGQPEYLAQAYRDRAEARARARDIATAFEDLEHARAIADDLEESAVRAYLIRTIEVVEGAAWIPRDPTHAAWLLSAVLAGFDRTENAYFRSRVLGLRAQALEGAGDLRGALDDRLREIELLESQRAEVEDGSRLVALEPAQAAYDAAAEILIELGLSKEALTLAERGRGRYLLDLLGETIGTQIPPLGAEEIQRRLPPGTTLVEYMLLDRQLAAWVIDRHGARLVRVPVARHEVGDLVSTWINDIERLAPDSVLHENSAALYRLLVAPLDLELDLVDRVVFVPDRQLFRVPFSALFDRRRSRYMIEAAAVAIAPSASVFLADRAIGRASGEELVIADPDLRDTHSRVLPRLSGAREEADAVLSLYPRATLLVGSEATAEAFLARLAEARMLHFAGHALANSDRAMRSEFLLASSGDHPGPVPIAELLQAKALGPDLVVLSACGTADGFTVDREGPVGLATAFLGTGSRAVLATLWRLEDRAAPDLLRSFHQGILDGWRPSEAWRLAVLHQLRDPDRDPSTYRNWAAFSLFEAASIVYEN